jgi:hypothetical protein
MAKTRMCECRHVWEEHEALAGAASDIDQIVVCMHIDRITNEAGQTAGYEVCACKKWRPVVGDEVPVPRTP